ncbi:hypothetical protein BZA70DRAFT_93694 [Myxozyma melibiosi]|uniref:Zn(2)-C6 fungal-type domain-containing protein n=1 Tax=Myxozyma melibiosi TaxID=54550 RepID=A0ABR1EYW1_9ASCO
MFVFPANNDGYRQRKKSFKACEQCKRQRRRCQPSNKPTSGCAKCMRNNIRCSLIVDLPPTFGAKKSPAAVLGDGSSPAESNSSKENAEKSGSSRSPISGSISPGLQAALEMRPKSPGRLELESVMSINSAIARTRNEMHSLPRPAPIARSHPGAITSIGAVVNPIDHEIIPPAEAVVAESDSTVTTPRRFISNLDPTSELVQGGSVDNDKIGVWLASENATAGPGNDQRRQVHVPPPMNQQLVLYLNTLRAFEVLPEPERDGLVDVYFRQINSILPLVDEKIFRRQLMKQEHSLVLLQCILLAACRHPEAGQFLRETEPRDFAAATHAKIKALLFASLEQDPITLVRVYALASLHSEGPRGLTDAAKDISLAFHYAHYSGIHLRRDHLETAAPNTMSALQKLWLSLWCLDHMSACVTGHPLNSHPRDVGLPMDDSTWAATRAEPLARITEACYMLDTTIDLYRPRPSEKVLDLKQPVFEKEEIMPRLVHSTAIMLFYKRLHSLTEQLPESTMQTLLTAAEDILEIAEERRIDLPPLPIVPYSVAMTLTVFLRLYPAPAARTGWRRSCELLDNMGRYWWIAEAMSSMGKRVFKKLEEDYNRITGDWTLEDYISSDRAPAANGQTMGGVLDQAWIFQELDKDVVDYWFPNMSELDQLYAEVDMPADLVS